MMRFTERGEMPKEQINYPELTSNLVEEEYATATGDSTTIHVGWNDDGWVQIGMEVQVDYAQFAIDSPNGSTSARTILYTPVLTASEINGMMRTLRRAKRKAYGRTA